MNSHEQQPIVRSAQSIAGGGGLETPVPSSRDAYEILDDLMAVVEALCPRWPDRETFRQHDDFRL